MSEKLEELAAARKRRRRRRRKRQPVFTPVAFSSPEAPATVTPQQAVAEADEDDGPLEPSKVRGGSITIEIPARFLEIMQWGAGARRQSIEDFAVTILRGALTGMKPAWREAMFGSSGASAPKGEATNRLLERKRPST